MPAAPALVAAFSEHLPLVEELRRTMHQRARTRLLATTAVWLVSVVLVIPAIFGAGCLLSGLVPEHPLMLGAGVLLLMVVAIAAVATIDGRVSKRFADSPLPYAEAFRDQVVMPILRTSLPGVVVRPDEGLSEETIRNSALYLQTFKYADSRYGFSGRARDVRYSGSLVTISSRRYSSTARRDVTHTHFQGVLVHVARPMPVTGTVRLVDFPTYGGSSRDYVVRRDSRVVHARNTIERVDPRAAIILDEGQVTPPPLSDGVFQAWLELRTLLGDAFQVSLNATGVYLGVPVRSQRDAPLVERVSPPNRPEELAEDVELFQRAITAVDVLRRMFP